MNQTDASLVSQVAEAIVNARDMCGDEEAAAREAFAECGVNATPNLMRQAFLEASTIWNAARKAAGIKVKYRW